MEFNARFSVFKFVKLIHLVPVPRKSKRELKTNGERNVIQAKNMPICTLNFYEKVADCIRKK